MTKIGVVILNWRGVADTIECLESLIRSPESRHLHLIVIDNASGDDSVPKLERWAAETGIALEVHHHNRGRDARQHLTPALSTDGPHLTLIQSESNLGFCTGNNLGASYAFEAGADYALVLNNDTKAHPEFVPDLLDDLHGDDGTTLYSPQIARADAPDRIWWFGGIFTRTLLPLYINKGAPVRKDLKDPVPTQWVSGCATIISRGLFERIGLFDPIFFIWSEEWDLSLRARDLGVPMRILPQPLLFHKAGRSLGVISPMVFFYSTRNMMILRRRYLPVVKHLTILAGYLPRMLLRSVRLALRFRDANYVRAFFDAVLSSRSGGIWRRQS